MLASGFKNGISSVSTDNCRLTLQQRQPLVAAFIHCCFLARMDPERAGEIVPVDLSVSETDSSELVEVSN
jgi:hypothetical protein